MTAMDSGSQVPERTALEPWGTNPDMAELPEMASPPRRSVNSAHSTSVTSSQDSPIAGRTRRFSAGISTDWDSYTPLGRDQASTSLDLGDGELFDWSKGLVGGLQPPRTPNASGALYL